MTRQGAKSDPVAVRLRTLRAGLGLQSGEVAERLGIDPTTLSRLENGRTRPSIENAQKLAGFYGLSLDALLEAKENES